MSYSPQSTGEAHALQMIAAYADDLADGRENATKAVTSPDDLAYLNAFAARARSAAMRLRKASGGTT